MTGSETQPEGSCLWRVAPLLVAVLLACGVLWYLLPSSRPVVAGDSVDAMRRRMGKPDSMVTTAVPRSWDGHLGPRPTRLASGQAYTIAHYRSYRGRNMHLFLVTPRLYEQVTGTHPGPADLYVLEICSDPVDAAD